MARRIAVKSLLVARPSKKATIPEHAKHEDIKSCSQYITLCIANATVYPTGLFQSNGHLSNESKEKAYF